MVGNLWYRCEKCGVIDHCKLTAPLFNGTGMNCHTCMTGQWHGVFPQVQYDPLYHIVCNVHNEDLDRIASQPDFW